MRIGQVIPAQEAAWERDRRACYDRWRADKLARALRWLEGLATYREQVDGLYRIRDKFGKRFAEDCRKRLFGIGDYGR